MANDPKIVACLPEHLAPVAEQMRFTDAREVMAIGGYGPLEALEASLFNSSQAWAVIDDQGPAAVFGLGEGLVASPWLLATGRLVSGRRRWFLSTAREIVDAWRSEHTRLANFVDSRNVASIRWLRWLGFEIHPEKPMGPFGIPFHPFTWERS